MKDFNVGKYERKKRLNTKGMVVSAFLVGCVLTALGISFASYTVESDGYVVVNSKVGDFSLADVKIAVVVDGASQNTFPTKGSGYVFESVTCENGSTGTWDSTIWKLGLDVYGPDECTVSFVTATLADICLNQNAADCINENGIALASNEMNDDDPDGNVRYMGANPNNYVTFNGESWRIIGVFDVAPSASGSTQKRVKLIRTDSIGNYSWDSSDSTVNDGWGVNEWSQADIMTTLNSGAYYNRTNGTCYDGTNNSTTSCNFSSTGLTSEAKALISNAYWNTGTIDGTTNNFGNSTAPTLYAGERSTNTGKNCSSGSMCNDAVTRTTDWVGEVGLMYPSDYGYSTSGGSTTNRASCLEVALNNWGSTSYTDDCKNNVWLLNSSINQWTMTSSPSESVGTFGFYVCIGGCVSEGFNISNAFGVRPVVYLSSNVKITGGDGTSGNPYTLGL